MIDAAPREGSPCREDKEQSRKSAAAFRTISEVAAELDLPQHVLRFWESKFSQVRPMKRGGGRRYYRPEDVALLRHIRSLLHDDGYTIKGVQKLFREKGGAKGLLEDVATDDHANQSASAVPREPATTPPGTEAAREELQAILGELEDIRSLLAPDDN